MSPGTRFDANETNATYRPPREIAGNLLSEFASTPAVLTDTRLVDAPDPEASADTGARAAPANAVDPNAPTTPAVAHLLRHLANPCPIITCALRIVAGHPEPGQPALSAGGRPTSMSPTD
ncbi:MAG: hypothetical protein H0W95_00035 [Nocardioidaceae bacterium]|nr:hypothetical protein [Nocardioidaceae bacterium]